MKDDILPIFGIQASWVCYKTGGCEHGVPDNADIAFLFLKTFRTKAEKFQDALLAAGAKGEAAVKERDKIADGDKELTRLQCPYLKYDEEGEFRDVYSTFIKIANLKAAQIAGKPYGEGESCTTTAWQGEYREFISTFEEPYTKRLQEIEKEELPIAEKRVLSIKNYIERLRKCGQGLTLKTS